MLVHQAPSKWIVEYSIIGWTLGAIGGNASMFISEKQALYAIGAIKRAVAICAMKNNLQWIDDKCHAQWDEQFMLEQEKDNELIKV